MCFGVFGITVSVGTGILNEAESTHWLNQFPKVTNVKDFFEHGYYWDNEFAP